MTMAKPPRHFGSRCHKHNFQKRKGVFSKPSGKLILGPGFCFLSWRPQILAICLFFNFAELCKVSVILDNIDIRHFMPKVNHSGVFSWVMSEISYIFVGFMPL